MTRVIDISKTARERDLLRWGEDLLPWAGAVPFFYRLEISHEPAVGFWFLIVALPKNISLLFLIVVPLVLLQVSHKFRRNTWWPIGLGLVLVYFLFNVIVMSIETDEDWWRSILYCAVTAFPLLAAWAAVRLQRCSLPDLFAHPVNLAGTRRSEPWWRAPAGKRRQVLWLTLKICSVWLICDLTQALRRRTFEWQLMRRRYIAVSYELLTHDDQRPPILFLRSFVDDELKPFEGLSQAYTLEEIVTEQFWPFGPVIAIGRPGEPLPLPGAARQYLLNQEWRSRVSELCGVAQMIVIVIGKSPGLRWELQQVISQGHASKLLLVGPRATIEELSSRWKSIWADMQTYRVVVAQELPANLTAAFFSSDGDLVLLRADRAKTDLTGPYDVAIDIASKAILERSGLSKNAYEKPLLSRADASED
jgi:hypothetical protein